MDYDFFESHPDEIIAVGNSLLPQWQAMQAEAQRIGDAGYNYELLSQNSNSFVDHQLRAAGLPEPGFHDFGENYAPGSGKELTLSEFMGTIARNLLWLGAGGAMPHLDAGAGGIFSALFDLDLGEAFGSPPPSPLVVDLDGDGAELIGLGGSEALFDLNVDGFAELTGWVRADDGLLAFDRNGNGRIDDNLELFGTGAGHANGFLHLAELDTNQDGTIDSADADFSALSIWRDLDGDGLTDNGELLSLSSYAITSIDLAATAINETNEGHSVRYRSRVNLADGSTAVVDDVFFTVDSRVAAKRLPDDFAFKFEALALPLLAGYGTVASTWVALSEDNALLTSAKGLLAQLEQGDVAGYLDGFGTFLLDWAGVSGVNPASAGSNVDARHLAFLEAMYGQAYGGGIPGSNADQALEAQFGKLVEKLAVRFMAQAPGASAVLSLDGDAGNHPLAFLASLAADLTAGSFRLQGSLDRVLAGAGDALDQGTLSLQDIAAALHLARHDLGFSSASTLAAELVRIAAGRMETAVSEVMIAARVEGKSVIVGTVADESLNASVAAVLIGREGSDVIDGSEGNDLLLGGVGNDILRGGQGSDRYLYHIGDGANFLYDYGYSTGSDRILLGGGISASGVSLTRSASDLNDLTLGFAGGGSIFLSEQFKSSLHGIEFVQFADGTVWDLPYIRNRLLQSSDANDIIDLTASAITT